MEKVTRNSKGGRPSKFSEAEKNQIIMFFNSGMNKTQLAAEFNCSVSTIASVLREARKQEREEK